MKWLVRTWVPIVIAVSAVFLLIYGAVQQNYRASLNDPQIQLAEDAAAALKRGVGAENVLWNEMPLSVSTSSHSQIDIATSLAPWTALYGVGGTPLDSTGLLNGSLPSLPAGVFEAAKGNVGKTNQKYENRITWQPQSGVRQAVIIVYIPQLQEYVVAGRNMREVEARVHELGLAVFGAWIATILATLLWGIGGMLLSERRRRVLS